MAQEQELEYLSILDESENSRYNSRGVFGTVGHGVEVEDYDDFTLYDWKCGEDFDEVLGTLEPLYPLAVDPALELIKEEGRVRDADRDHDTLTNDLVYDPVREWRGEDRWNEYSLIQVNLSDAKVVWDQKRETGETRMRVYELEDETDVFEKLYHRTLDAEDTEEIIEEVNEVF